MHVRQFARPGLHGSGIDPGTGTSHRDEPLHGLVELLSPAGMQLACGDEQTLAAASPQDVVQRVRAAEGWARLRAGKGLNLTTYLFHTWRSAKSNVETGTVAYWHSRDISVWSASAFKSRRLLSCRNANV